MQEFLENLSRALVLSRPKRDAIPRNMEEYRQQKNLYNVWENCLYNVASVLDRHGYMEEKRFINQTTKKGS